MSIRPIKTCNRTTLPSFGGSLTYSSGGVMGGRHPYYFMGHARFSPRSSRRISTRLPTTVDSKRLMASTTTIAAKGKMAVIKHSSSGQVDLESCRCCHKSWSLQRRNFFGATLSHRITIVTQLAQS